MNKEQRNLLIILLVTFVWMLGSTIIYTCNIKGFCNSNNDNKILSEKYDKEDEFEDYGENEVIEEEEFFEEEVVFEEVEVEKVVENKNFEKRTISCYTHINSMMRVNYSKNIPSEVEKLENFFNNYYEADLDINGIYGVEDREEVLKFQEIKNLDRDGVVGPKTLEVINAVYCVKNENKN